jgi:hypothetical protein
VIVLKKKRRINSLKNAIEEECVKVNGRDVHKLALNYYTVDQVKELLHFKNKQTVYNLVQSGDLLPTKITGKLLFDKKMINKRINK